MDRIHRSTSLAILAALAVLGGSACSDDATSDPDATARDAESIDARPPADGGVDAGGADALPDRDALPLDSGPPDSGTSTTAACPLSPRGRIFAENLLTQFALQTGLVALHARPREAAFVMAIPGREMVLQNYAFLIDECRMPLAYDPFCQGPDPGDPSGFFVTRDLCTQMSCAGEGIGIYDLWLTMVPRVRSDDLHPFTYTSTAPAGEVTIDPNPHLRWVADLRRPEEALVRGRIDWNLTLSATGSPDLVGDFTAYAAGHRMEIGGSEEIEVRLGFEFPRLASGGALVTASATVAFDHSVRGSIESGGRTLATVGMSSQQGVLVAIDWLGTCR